MERFTAARKGIDGRFHAPHRRASSSRWAACRWAPWPCRKFSRCSKGRWCRSRKSPSWCTEGKLETTQAEEIERKYEQFRQEFTVVYRKTLTLSRELASELSYLEQEAASVLVDGFIEELKEKYPATHVAEYLEEVRHNILDNLDPFKEREGEEDEAAAPPGKLARPRPRRSNAIRFASTA